MKRAIIYGRKSTNKQSVETIETQISECKRWADNNNAMIVKIYDDSGQSGQSYNVHNRDGFQQIKEDAKNGLMDYALIYRIDRFARSVKDYFNNESILESYGVKVIVVSMPHLQDADIVVKALYVAMAEQFSKSLSEDVAVKMLTFAKKAAFLGGKPPIGYIVTGEGSERKLTIDDTHAPTVRLIYDLYLQGYGYIKIAAHLRDAGILSRDNNLFSPAAVQWILKNKKYNGWYVRGRLENINGKAVPTKESSKLIEIPNAHKKIIDDETFNAVQNRMNSNAPKPKIKKRIFHFTGIIRCAECGRAFVGHSSKNKDGSEYPYYRCTGRHPHKCSTRSVRADFLEEIVTKEIQSRIFDEAFSKNLIAEIEKSLSADVQLFKKDKKRIEKEIEKTESQIKEAMKDKHSKATNPRIYEDLMQEYNDSLEMLELRLISVTQHLNAKDSTSEVTKYIKFLKQNLNKSPDEVKTAFIRQTVNSILISNDKIEVFLRLSSNDKPLKDKRSSSVSNIQHGVPCLHLTTHSVYMSNGVTLLSFPLGSIKYVNYSGK